MRILLIWVINALVLYLLPYLIPGISIQGFGSALIAVAALGLVNAIVRPIFVLLTLPVTVLTLGLFLFVVNALMFWFVGRILEGFHVDGFVSALLGSLVYSALTWLLSSVLAVRGTDVGRMV